MSSRGRSNKGSNAGGSDSGAIGGVKVVVTDETVEPEASFPGRSCRVCRTDDSDEMVRCDRCLKWFHFSCVGVTQAIENDPWSCKDCANAEQVPEWLVNPCDGGAKKKHAAEFDSDKLNLPPLQEQDDPLTPKTSKASKVGGQAESKRNEKKAAPKGRSHTSEQPHADQKQLRGTNLLQSKEIDKHPTKKNNKSWARVSNQTLPKETGEKPSTSFEKAKSVISHASSRASSRSSQSLAKLKLQKLEEERILNAKKLEQEQAYLEEKYRLLEEMVSERGSDVNSVSDAVSEWRPRAQSSHRSQLGDQRSAQHEPFDLGAGSPGNLRCRSFVEEQRSVHREVPHFVNRVTEREEDCCSLTKKQLAARQAVSKDLPQFSGNPEDWPLFITTFNNTTTMCGFTNEENIFRLQKSLKGRAFEAVKSRLVHPSNVPGVLKTLKMMFGQPEAIVHTLIEKINSLPPIREDKLETLVDFAVNVENFCATVDACGLDEYLYNTTLLHQLVSKLPPTIKLNWAQYRISLPGVNLAAFSTWMYALAEAASAVTIPNITNTRQLRNESRSAQKGNAFVNAHSESSSATPRSSYPSDGKQHSVGSECIVCKGTCKTVDKCKRFLEFSRDSRWSVVREFALCRRCLCRHNGLCQAKSCGKNGCQFKHHALLHNDQKQQSSATPVAPSSSTAVSSAAENHESPKAGSSSTAHGCHTHQAKSSDVLFRYLPVVLHGKHRSIRTYAFLDDGSDLTLLDEELADELELDGEVRSLCLHWTGGTQRQEVKSKIVELEIAGVHSGARNFAICGARTVNELLLPYQTLNIDELSTLYPHLQRLPIDSYRNVRPRILIGLKNQHLSLALKCREGKPKDPVAIKTRLGWTVCGGETSESATSPVHSVYHIGSCEDHNKADEDLHQVIKDYFALDSLGIMKPNRALLSVDDQRAQSLLQSLTKFTGERYETGLLWRHETTRLPDSQGMAHRRFQCLEKRMSKDDTLAKTLREKMADHLAKGYVRKLSDDELQQAFQRVWYLPVFPVTNPNKPGKGPDNLSSLFTVLIRFREHPVALTGDKREMFHQVLIRKDDQHCQRFYWRDEDGKTAVYVMCVMTFGACCSPSSAQYAMNLNAKRFDKEYPEAVEVIEKQHYVDDMLVSVDTEEEAIKLAEDVRFVHSQGGFEIRNWTSNSQRVLEALRSSNAEEKSLDLSPEMTAEKVLGMWWCTATDVFTYKVGWDRYDQDLWEGLRQPTKREVLRVLMTIFDPLGLIAPFLMFLKILLQEIWRSGIQWDDRIDDNAFTKWRSWLQVLPQVEHVQIQRCFRSHLNPAYDDVQLHTFVDASENGMAAACFLRFVRNEVVWCCLVAAKTRVAPLRYHSIPRLELMAAVIGKRLSQTVIDSLTFNVSKRFYHSDSRDVICWLYSDHRRYTPFVACRVSEILETTEQYQWRWVPTKLNVADDATKWEKFPDMTPESRWFIGPDFLRLPEEAWPCQSVKGSKTDTELRPRLLTHFTLPDPAINVSSWKRMLKVATLVHRFPANCRLKKQRKPILRGPPSTEELQLAERYVIRQAQREAYPEETATLQHPSKSIPKTSSLYKLTPWLDDHGLMRMRGRISACAQAIEDSKNPIILPRDHHTTKLIIAHYHNKYKHQNHETAINELRQRYCIPRLRATYAKVRYNCQHCKNNRAVPQPPMMAELPPERLDAFARPFTNIGVDYFGPMEVVVGRRVEKRWGMLITCLTTRAIHIEVVHTLSTDSCIMGLRNFVARRGTPKTIYSDRGTCFIGASRELQNVAVVIDQDEVMKEFGGTETTWKFNPPAAPHMGGSWERLIGVVKRNLMAIRPPHKPNDEVLRNLLAEIENTVNSRPLTHVPVDDEAAPALTLNHFLLGSSDGTKPLCTIDDSGAVLRRTWKLSQQLANQFWKLWLTEYLPEITRRTKWFTDTKPITMGDVVVIVDPKLPRNCWPKGKIIATSVSPKDNRIRSATVQTATGVFERPTAKLAVLDVRRDEL
ncbi:uncharacterized protein LOC109410494 [Aedes albopictus]|uniref:Uncharacterized protein n=1 Tax=Aedes albopictus TaxID=7160 RepID=A0ABM1YZU5_AEDAL